MGFPVSYHSKRYLEPVGVYVHLRVFFEHLKLCFHFAHPFGFFVTSFPFPYSAPKFSCLSRTRFLVWLPLIVGKNIFVVLERPVFSILFGFVSVSFVFLLSLVFLFGFLKLFLSSSCRAHSVFSEKFLMIRFSILACCRIFFICDSSLGSNPGFDFLPVVFKGTPVFHRLIFLLRKLYRLTPWYGLSGCLSISRLFSQFQNCLSSSHGSWEKVMWFSHRTWLF